MLSTHIIRALLTLVTFMLVSLIVAWLLRSIGETSREEVIVYLIVLAALAMLLWFRTRQRAYYYVREVLLAAERLISQPTINK